MKAEGERSGMWLAIAIAAQITATGRYPTQLPSATVTHTSRVWQFDLAPVDDPATVASREAGLSVSDLGGRPFAVRFRDAAGSVFAQGRRQRDPILTGASTYVVFGAGEVRATGGVAMLADPALPAWLETDVARFAPQVAATYASKLGNRSDPRLPLLVMG